MYNCTDYTLLALKCNEEHFMRTVQSFLLSLLLHLVLLLLLALLLQKPIIPPRQGKEEKIALNLSQFVPPAAPKPMVTPPVQPHQPLMHPIQKKSLRQTPATSSAKKKLPDQKNRIYAPKESTTENNITKMAKKSVIKKMQKKITKQTVKKPVSKPAPKPVTKAVLPQKTSVKKIQPKPSKDPLANALMGTGIAMHRPAKSQQQNQTNSMIDQLYGKEFEGFSQTQKKFIRNNLGTIHRITQNTLSRNGYPTVAVQTRQEGINVVSFNLHPNGDISDLRLKKPMGYAALDENTLEVIRIAYKEYPRPSKTTKIIFYVQYRLY